MTNAILISNQPSITPELRSMMAIWAVAAFLPIPILVATDPTKSADISCIYLGVINAWLVTEFRRSWGLPETPTSWRRRMFAVASAVFLNVSVFIGFGLAAGVQTHFPFALMAVLSALPVVGVMPWMLRRVPQQPYAAIVFSGFLVFSCKLAACVVARIVYGPNYIEQGYVAGDWRTAKLMITLLWSFSTLLSMALLIADYQYCVRKNREHAA